MDFLGGLNRQPRQPPSQLRLSEILVAMLAKVELLAVGAAGDGQFFFGPRPMPKCR